MSGAKRLFGETICSYANTRYFKRKELSASNVKVTAKEQKISKDNKSKLLMNVNNKLKIK